MKSIRILFTAVVASLILLISCDTEDIQQLDDLEQIGILGQWKLDSREVNGISSLIVECCDYIEFKPDNEPNDLNGKFKAFGVGYETNGVFELNSSDGTITFLYDEKQLLFEIEIGNEIIVFSYSENSDSIVEYWHKEE